jgi:hypothetical protein
MVVSRASWGLLVAALSMSLGGCKPKSATCARQVDLRVGGGEITPSTISDIAEVVEYLFRARGWGPEVETSGTRLAVRLRSANDVEPREFQDALNSFRPPDLSLHRVVTDWDSKRRARVFLAALKDQETEILVEKEGVVLAWIVSQNFADVEHVLDQVDPFRPAKHQAAMFEENLLLVPAHINKRLALILVERQPVFSRDNLLQMQVRTDAKPRPRLAIQLNASGQRTLRDVTTQSLGRPFAFLVDGEAASLQFFETPLEDGHLEIDPATLTRALYRRPAQLAAALRIGLTFREMPPLTLIGLTSCSNA